MTYSKCDFCKSKAELALEGLYWCNSCLKKQLGIVIKYGKEKNSKPSKKTQES
jgi:hypothetical protein